MSKMLFTFKWGRSIYVTDDHLKKILLKYYTKTEVDDILKRYVKIEDLAADLVEYAKLDDLHILDNHLTGMINDNTELINGNTETLNEVIDALKNAKLWNIVGMWDSGTSYKIGDVVGYTDNELYLSVVDDNLNHIPSDTPSNWIKITGVQSFNLDDYYDKTQINELLNSKTVMLNKTNSMGATTVLDWGISGINDGSTYIDDFRVRTRLINLEKEGDGSNNTRIIRQANELGIDFYGDGDGSYTINASGTPTKNTDITTKQYVDNAIANVPSGGSTIKCVVKHDGGTVHMPSDRTKVEIIFTSDENPEVIQAYKDNRFVYNLRTGGNTESGTNEFIIMQGVETLYESGSYSDLTISAYVENLNEEPSFILVLCNFVYW